MVRRPKTNIQQEMRRSLPLLMTLSLYLAADVEKTGSEEEMRRSLSLLMRLSLYLAADGKNTRSKAAAG
jgi:hypothetical protein